MGRKKSYTVDRRSSGSDAEDISTDSATHGRPRKRDEALIYMPDILGEDPLGTSTRRIDFRPWLDKGIDNWVWAAVDGFTHALRAREVEAASINSYARGLHFFFDFLLADQAVPRVPEPSRCTPQDVQAFVEWLHRIGAAEGAKQRTTSHRYRAARFALGKMMDLGLIAGERARFFPRGAVRTGPDDDTAVTALSDAEQERLARAIQHDLAAAHGGRLALIARDVQVLRFLVVAHRQGANTTPLLELDRREALKPGLSADTRTMTLTKRRSHKRFSLSLDSRGDRRTDTAEMPSHAPVASALVFTKTEAAVLAMAIRDSEAIACEAAPQYRHRVWLYRAASSRSLTKMGAVKALHESNLRDAITALVKRHDLRGDDGRPLRVTNGRLRKSYFARVLRITGGDVVRAANLMGNTPHVAATNYPSLTMADKAAAARFINEELIAQMKAGLARFEDHSPAEHVQPTAVGSCRDTINGQHAPRNGNACDRFVMCLFCRSFAVAGEVDELWRLYSFQAFARAELDALEKTLGPGLADDERLEDLRQRYRFAVPHIDDFTRMQFAAGIVEAARARTASELHPFWVAQMARSRRARLAGDDDDDFANSSWQTAEGRI